MGVRLVAASSNGRSVAHRARRERSTGTHDGACGLRASPGPACLLWPHHAGEQWTAQVPVLIALYTSPRASGCRMEPAPLHHCQKWTSTFRSRHTDCSDNGCESGHRRCSSRPRNWPRAKARTKHILPARCADGERCAAPASLRGPSLQALDWLRSKHDKGQAATAACPLSLSGSYCCRASTK